MNLDKKKFLLLYFTTFLLFAIYFLINTTACEAYYMHDDSIEISPLKLIIRTAVLFLVPALLILTLGVLKLKADAVLFILHYFLVVISLGIFALVIDKPCESINGGHYMFIDFFGTGFSYLLRFISYITLILLFIRTLVHVIKAGKNNSNNKETN